MNSRLDCIGDWAVLAKVAKYDAKFLASLCNISTRQLERYCRDLFKKSPQQCLNEFRLTEAQALLVQGLSVKEIAYSLGYKQASHFSREFKRYSGLTPSSTRRGAPQVADG